jgi:hypothetical protein
MVPDSSVSGIEDNRYLPGLGALPKAVLVPHWNTLDELLPGLQDDVWRNVPGGTTMIAVEDRTAVFGDGHHWNVYGEGDAYITENGQTTRLASGEDFVVDLPLIDERGGGDVRC